MNMPLVTATSLADPLYYLRNAQQVIELCLSQYSDLLTPGETQQLQQLLQLDTPAQALLVRLVMRKGTLFRTDKLSYTEVPDLSAALRLLSALGLVSLEPELLLSELCHLAKREECVALARLTTSETLFAASSRKGDLVSALLEQATTDDLKTLAAWWPDAPFTVIQLSCASLFDRLRLMFFGNLRQDWSEFVLTELGLQQFEAMPLNSDSKPFQARAEVDLYLALQQLQSRVFNGEPIANIRPLLPAPVACEWIEYRRHKVLYQFGREAERQQDLSLALDLYQQSKHREAQVRTLRLLEKQLSPAEVFTYTTQALINITQPEARVTIERIRQRSAKKAGIIYTPPISLNVPSDSEILERPTQGRVEAAVIAHLTSDTRQVFHVENRLFNGLFALLFWPALFAPIRGAFFNPFQAGPADLYRPDFIDSRAQWLNEGFAQLKSGEYKEVIKARYQQKYGISCAFMHWPSLSYELIEMALTVIPTAHLTAVFNYLLLDLRHHRKGMPDLLELDLANQSYRLIEVKGPGDRLQDHQRLWIQTMLAQGLPVSVMQVSWSDN
ncbi:VRR-NUC domain-containing protein [Oceanisphaera profunda]|uniref:phosphodiesterase I n=1 Tax=Oceanisphaera profunda TaxID=1416627 RepID=A0A1Y0D7Z3_9GAMM|nr:VRR-NUC domain-containing protein [Oceanisphaera profunda]ART83175.1 VRR-NUC domain-containing protein [Oceanisphaera profunda]